MGFHLPANLQGVFSLRNVEAPVRTLNNRESIPELKVSNIHRPRAYKVYETSRLNHGQLQDRHSYYLIIIAVPTYQS